MMMTHPLICATVTAKTTALLRAARDAAAGVDLVELRLDTVSDPDVGAALDARRCPAVITCRPAYEGGAFRGSEAERRALLLRALDGGAEHVDLEWSAGFDDEIRRRRGRNIVLSLHDFTGVPADLADKARAMLATGADIVKIAVMATRLSDCLPLLELGRRHRDGRLVLIAMGAAGVVSRVFAARFGSCWTYAGEGVAPGQLTVDELTREFTFRRIGADTSMYGLIGRPVAHSLSPCMHNASFAALGVDAAYVPLAAADIDDAMRFAQGAGLAGLSVTTPFKVDIVSELDELDGHATAAGAVNTIARREGRWAGTNTDGRGFLAGLGGVPVKGWRAAVLGTGGAARAVALALRDREASVTLYGRSGERARAVAAALGVQGAARPVPPGSWDLLVNATPVGMVPDEDASAFDEGIYDGQAAYDLVYKPPRTRFLREAEAAGCRCIGGLDMLVAQAQLQAEWWTGRRPDAAWLREAAQWKLSTLTERP